MTTRRKPKARGVPWFEKPPLWAWTSFDDGEPPLEAYPLRAGTWVEHEGIGYCWREWVFYKRPICGYCPKPHSYWISFRTPKLPHQPRNKGQR